MVRLTPNGLSVRPRQRAISLTRSSGVGWVSAVMKPSAPALATAATSSAAADPLHPALHDRVLDADHFGKSRFQHVGPQVPSARNAAQFVFFGIFPKAGCRPSGQLSIAQTFRSGDAIMQEWMVTFRGQSARQAEFNKTGIATKAASRPA